MLFSDKLAPPSLLISPSWGATWIFLLLLVTSITLLAKSEEWLLFGVIKLGRPWEVSSFQRGNRQLFLKIEFHNVFSAVHPKPPRHPLKY